MFAKFAKFAKLPPLPPFAAPAVRLVNSNEE
jgi:hypothetical protein